MIGSGQELWITANCRLLCGQCGMQCSRGRAVPFSLMPPYWAPNIHLQRHLTLFVLSIVAAFGRHWAVKALKSPALLFPVFSVANLPVPSSPDHSIEKTCWWKLAEPSGTFLELCCHDMSTQSKSACLLKRTGSICWLPNCINQINVLIFKVSMSSDSMLSNWIKLWRFQQRWIQKMNFEISMCTKANIFSCNALSVE